MIACPSFYFYFLHELILARYFILIKWFFFLSSYLEFNRIRYQHFLISCKITNKETNFKYCLRIYERLLSKLSSTRRYIRLILFKPFRVYNRYKRFYSHFDTIFTNFYKIKRAAMSQNKICKTELSLRPHTIFNILIKRGFFKMLLLRNIDP